LTHFAIYGRIHLKIVDKICMEVIFMKATGIVRKVDELGRIVLPIELRRTLNIAEKDSLEIFVEGSNIILSKYEPSCIFCGSDKDIINFKDKNVCSKSASTIGK
jgi:transcriptional pleiotropic regulator of transition state genes